MRNKKIILDTNLWISFLISKKLESIDDLIISGKIELIFSKELIEEFITVIKRPKFINYFSDGNIESLLNLFDKYGKLVNVTTKTNECRDDKDNFLLNLAIDSKADFLITGDADLLIIKKIAKTNIITWAEFTKKLK